MLNELPDHGQHFIWACVFSSLTWGAMRILSLHHILPDPNDLFWRSPWQQRDEPGGGEGGREAWPRQLQKCEAINQWADIKAELIQQKQKGLLLPRQLQWVIYCTYQHAKDTALLHADWAAEKMQRQMNIFNSSRKNVRQGWVSTLHTLYLQSIQIQKSLDLSWI